MWSKDRLALHAGKKKKKILLSTLKKGAMDAISCCSIGSLCFPQKDWTKGQMTTEFMQRHVPFIDCSSPPHTSVHTHVCIHARFSREPQRTRYSSSVRTQLGTVAAFRRLLIYLGWTRSIWKPPQQLTDRETKKFQSSAAKKHQFRRGHNGSAVVAKRREENG